jgi:FKBP-type peptidyl-prolyl cis-trans isomerase FklB
MNLCNTQWPRRGLALATLVVMTAVSQAQSPPPSPPPASAPATVPASVSNEDSSYSVGLGYGNQLPGAGLGETLSFDAVVRGLKEGLAGKALSPDDKEHALQLVRSGRDVLATRNHAAAKDYLAQNAKAPGVTTTASGLQYQVIEAGEAKSASPVPGDRVTVHYRGRLIDGTEFDSSDAHAQAATFNVNAVIKGWREALLLMKPNAKWRLFVPPELGYDLNSPPTIPPGSMLIFDVELLKIEPAPVMAPQPPKAPKGSKPSAAKPPAKPAAAGT